MSMNDSFGPCEICGAAGWRPVYQGPVRDGAFGKLTPPTTVGRCANCGAERLAERSARSDDFYQGVDYRQALAEPTDAAGFFAEHDLLQLQNLQQLWPEPLRGKVIADIGCAAGSFLDHVRGLPAKAIAVEPCLEYHESLVQRGYEVHSFAANAAAARGTVDWAFSFSVIEHVGDPRAFLEEIGSLLKPGGRMLISTPNRGDILMNLLPDSYPPFFYRAVHRWYFDRESLAACVRHAGLRMVDLRCVHRFGISNALLWLRDRKPSGRRSLPQVGTPLLDDVWARSLEAADAGDYLYAIVERPSDGAVA